MSHGLDTTLKENENTVDENGMTKEKRVVFIRHGRTYMNDFINGIHYGQPGFTDVFPDTQEYRQKFYDSPLGPRGVVQVDELNVRVRRLLDGDTAAAKEMSLQPEHWSILDEIDLIVSSPLTRALQTMDKGLHTSLQSKNIPVVAVPQAAERIFLVADLGKTRRELKQSYPYVDFDTAFPSHVGDDDEWNYVPTDDEKENYVEWRPSGDGQVYACLGEPQDQFEKRMERLLAWLDSRVETTIVVVCHAGVILWFLGEVIDNCQVRVVNIQDLKNPMRLYEVPQEQAKQLK